METKKSPIAESEGFSRLRPLVANKTALLFVDVQQSEITETCQAERPQYFASITQLAIPNQQKLLSLARRLGVEVIYTVIESLTSDGRDRSLDHKLSDFFIPKGSPLALMIPEVRPQNDEIVLRKTSSGVFNSTNIEYLLRNMGIENLLVVGFLTDQCVDMAIRDGADRGFFVTCVADACASYTEVRHQAGLTAFAGYCYTTDTKDMLLKLQNDNS